jgi:hypothetical protein
MLKLHIIMQINENLRAINGWIIAIKSLSTVTFNNISILYHYFDRNTNIGNDSSHGNKNKEEDVSRRYAALNLASLHYRFGHR